MLYKICFNYHGSITANFISVGENLCGGVVTVFANGIVEMYTGHVHLRAPITAQIGIQICDIDRILTRSSLDESTEEWVEIFARYDMGDPFFPTPRFYEYWDKAAEEIKEQIRKHNETR